MTTKLNTVREAITGTATKIFSANAYANFREIRNLDTTNAIELFDAAGGVYGAGYPLKAGEVITMDRKPPHGEIWAITAGSSVNIAAVEY